MKNQKSNQATSTQNGKRSTEKSGNSSMKSSQLMELFEEQLRDIYWAEKALTKAIPKMVKNATSQKLIDALNSHLSETEEHIARLEQVFKSIGKRASGKKCDAMEGLVKEAEELMESCEEGAMCDAGIILAGQKVEHYEIATYGTLCAYAKTLGEKDAEKLLKQTLDEEKKADVKLSEISKTINVDAAEKVESGSDNGSSKVAAKTKSK